MSMAQDGYTAQDIRKPQLQMHVGRSEAVRLLKLGKGSIGPELPKDTAKVWDLRYDVYENEGDNHLSMVTVQVTCEEPDVMRIAKSLHGKHLRIGRIKDHYQGNECRHIYGYDQETLGRIVADPNHSEISMKFNYCPECGEKL